MIWDNWDITFWCHQTWLAGKSLNKMEVLIIYQCGVFHCQNLLPEGKLLDQLNHRKIRVCQKIGGFFSPPFAMKNGEIWKF